MDLFLPARILEDFLSARAIQREYLQRTGVHREVVSLAAAAAEDVAALETFADFGRHLGQALRATLSDFAPDVVVLGGGISQAAPLFRYARSELAGLSFRLEVSAMRDCAALVGAAVAWFNRGSVGHESDPESVSAAAQNNGA